MADLSAYIDFSVALDKSGDTPVIRLTDPDDYPGATNVYIRGVFSITQPDGITVTGNFTSPDVTWNGSALTVDSKELRLTTADKFQNGLYTITYTVKCVGYSDTVLTKTFILSYAQPTVIITNLFDVFTPYLTVIDGTPYYSQVGFTVVSVTRAWEANIKYIGGDTIGNKTGTLLLFDLIYSGDYYDALYLITLDVTTTYTLNSYSWVTIIDLIEAATQIDAFTPPTLAVLLTGLNDLYAAITDGTYCGCGCDCSPDYTVFTQAQALYDNIVENGQAGNIVTGDCAGKIDKLIKIFNCSGIISRSHTNDVIPAYDWGTTQVFSLHPPIQFTVGSGATYVPDNGDTSYINPTLAGNNSYLIFLAGQADYLVEGVDFTYRTGGGFDLTSQSFVGGDRWTLSFYA